MLAFLAFLGAYLVAGVKGIADWVLDWLSAIWDTVVGFLLTGPKHLMEWVVSLMPLGWQDYLHQPMVADSMAATVHAVSYFVPIKSLLVVVSGGLGMAAFLRLLRWVKSFLPTIDS